MPAWIVRADPAAVLGCKTMSDAWPYERTRDTILRAAASLATVDGLDRLSIGRPAAVLGMSKSSLHAHFGATQELQRATGAAAARGLRTGVVRPAVARPAA